MAAKQNPELVKKYGIHGYPSTIIVRPSGEEVKRFGGFQRGGVDAFLESLKAVSDEFAPKKDAGGGKPKN